MPVAHEAPEDDVPDGERGCDRAEPVEAPAVEEQVQLHVDAEAVEVHQQEIGRGEMPPVVPDAIEDRDHVQGGDRQHHRRAGNQP